MDSESVVSGVLTKDGLIQVESDTDGYNMIPFDQPPPPPPPPIDSGDVDMAQGVKRPHSPSEVGDTPPVGGNIRKKRFKTKKTPKANTAPKNALMVLNELKPGLTFEMINQRGATHNPQFVMGVTIDGVLYEGMGRSKKLGRQRAAEKALAALAPDAVYIPVPADPVTETEAEPQTPTTPKTPKTPLNGSTVPEGKNHVMMLHELRPGTKYEMVSRSGTGPSMQFVMSVVVDEQTFEGTGHSKKMAKTRAAQTVLEKVFQMQIVTPSDLRPVINDFSIGDGTESTEASCQQLAATVSKLVRETLVELTSTDSTALYARYKVLSGIVLTRPGMPERVIAVSTGSKCINGEHINDMGLVVNDSHAEVISRRCLRRYLYSELQRCVAGDADSIVEQCETPGRFQLCSDVRLHLYISTAPCGDARVFSPHEVDGHPLRKKRGQLRTKIENGEGTTLAKQGNATQTWDGILHGERLLTMSCSDKVARWNLLGLQGALLTRWMSPVYLSSVIVENLYNADHLSRAVYGRLQSLLPPSLQLPPNYRMNTPMLSTLRDLSPRNPCKPQSHSINWTACDASMEVINAKTGLTQDAAAPSRLCKANMLRLFAATCDVVDTNPSMETISYDKAKLACEDYAKVKAVLVDAFSNAQLGSWIYKPEEQDQFSLPPPDETPMA